MSTVPHNNAFQPTENLPRNSRHLKLTREVSDAKSSRAKKDW